MPEDDKRPEPEFGVYATPEEQRRRMGLPAEPEAEASAQGQGVPGTAQASAPQRPSVRPGPAALPGTPAPFNWNRALTFLLLGVGLYVTLTSVPGLLDLYGTFSVVAEQLGVDGDTGLVNSLGLRIIGVVIALSYIVGWIAALWLSLRRLRRQVSSWWIPLVIGVVVTVIVFALLMAAMLSQPDFVTTLMDSAVVVPSGVPTPSSTP
ncbi:DUF6264 family protein [Mycetocola reblochoni]|uniref:Uncharacterized protein n=2 Tax=Mycetocola reblochoni TaxID=331618 RepID=A0A1R4IAH7_9MICO|nr:DUF6264 family protein [Mycetocola reblochoni]RLP67599.1 hypothetical protein D9V30_13770 [Mycetocola reblochoni]SJN16891.1 hypothetical protein FM119_00710 [Mycetocola reblochoni REB411]